MQFPTKDLTGATSFGGSDSIRHGLQEELIKSIRVIEQLDDICYRRRLENSSSIGEQFRHNLDFVNTFLLGAALGRIDYTRRERDLRVERSREWAVDRFESAGRKLEALSRAQINASVSVRSEVDAFVWLESSVSREMEFVLSHTVHHHALITEKLIGQGIILDAAFGVASSTKRYWSKLAA